MLCSFILVLARLTRRSILDKYSIWSFVLLTVGISLQLIASLADDFLNLFYAVDDFNDFEEIDMYMNEMIMFGYCLRSLGLIINIARWLLNQRKSIGIEEGNGLLHSIKMHPQRLVILVGVVSQLLFFSLPNVLGETN